MVAPNTAANEYLEALAERYQLPGSAGSNAVTAVVAKVYVIPEAAVTDGKSTAAAGIDTGKTFVAGSVGTTVGKVGTRAMATPKPLVSGLMQPFIQPDNPTEKR